MPFAEPVTESFPGAIDSAVTSSTLFTDFHANLQVFDTMTSVNATATLCRDERLAVERLHAVGEGVGGRAGSEGPVDLVAQRRQELAALDVLPQPVEKRLLLVLGQRAAVSGGAARTGASRPRRLPPKTRGRVLGPSRRGSQRRTSRSAGPPTLGAVPRRERP